VCVSIKNLSPLTLQYLQAKLSECPIPQIPLEISTRMRKTLRESRQGRTTKQANDLIVNESGIHYHYTHVYRLLYKWGFKQKVPRKVHVNTASKEEKEEVKKEQRWF
jgi:putative transposase